MHLVAANLWTWIRYVLLEERATREDILNMSELNGTTKSLDSSSESEEVEDTSAEQLSTALAVIVRARRSIPIRSEYCEVSGAAR